MQRQAKHYVAPGVYEDVEVCNVNYQTLRFLEDWADLIRSISPVKKNGRRVLGILGFASDDKAEAKEVQEGDIVVKFKDGSVDVYGPAMAASYISTRRNHG